MTINTKNLTPETLETLQLIRTFFVQSQTLFGQLPRDQQDAILELHNEEGSVNHAIRWGNQALEDILEAPQGPTPEQLSAITVFAQRYGKNWKEDLAFAWSTGADAREPNGHLLRQVRNQLGPAWLEGYELPNTKKKAAPRP